MLQELKLSTGSGNHIFYVTAYRPSCETGAHKWDVSGFLGHEAGDTTEVYAVGQFATVTRALQEIIDELFALCPQALHRTDTGTNHPVISSEVKKMTG